MGSGAADELESMVAAAVMYYEQNMAQQAIARRLGVSRSTVSRLLAQARQQGVVRIQVVPPNNDPTLAKQLQERLGLQSVYVAPGRAQESEPGPILAEPLTLALEEAGLAPGDVVLVSWGRAVTSVSRHVRRDDAGVIVAPAMGGYQKDEPWFQPNEIARSFALAVNGQPRVLNAPAIVSPELARALEDEAQTRSVMELWDRAKAAVVGVGAWPKPDASYAAAGFPADDPAVADAVGDVAGWSFTAEGRLLAWPPGRHLLGVTPEQLRQIPHVIGLAGGTSKARAAIGAACAGLISVLVTDAPTAREIFAMTRPR